MSVRATLLSIFFVALAAFSVITGTLYRSIEDITEVQARSAEDAEDLVLYLDLTIQVNRYVKESFDVLDNDEQQGELAEAKADALRKLAELEALENKLANAHHPSVEWQAHREIVHQRMTRVRTLFDTIVRHVDAARVKAKTDKNEASEQLDAAIERDYDHGFLRSIDEMIKEERARSGQSVAEGKRIARRVQATSFGAVIVSLLALVFLIGSRLRAMDRDVQALLRGAERLAAGDLDQRIHDVSKNELGKIGDSFNRMAAGLVAAQSAKIRAERLAAVGQAAASVGHDLRNPLGAIRNAIHYLKRRVSEGELGSDARVAQFFGVIEKELATSTKIIADLLDFARSRKLTVSACPLRPLIDDAISIVAPPRPMHIDNQVPDDLPVPSLDKDQLRQALVNLVQNATEAVPEAREGRIVIGAVATQDEVTLSIADNGDGIPEEERARIFEPFFTTKAKGTGLGLAITVGVIERHKGSLEVQSEPGAGTTFLVRLPLEHKGSEDHSLSQDGDKP